MSGIYAAGEPGGEPSGPPPPAADGGGGGSDIIIPDYDAPVEPGGPPPAEPGGAPPMESEFSMSASDSVGVKVASMWIG